MIIIRITFVQLTDQHDDFELPTVKVEHHDTGVITREVVVNSAIPVRRVTEQTSPMSQITGVKRLNQQQDSLSDTLPKYGVEATNIDELTTVSRQFHIYRLPFIIRISDPGDLC